MGIMSAVLGFLLFIVAIVSLYYFVRSLIVMFNESPLMGILGFLFAPIVHIVFYLTNKDKIHAEEATFFKRYFITIGIVFILAILFNVMAIGSMNEMANTGAY